MILVASSTGEVTETEINEEAQSFFKCSSNLHTTILLDSIVETAQIDCSVSNTMTTALIYGSFLWSNPLSPSGLAPSVLTSEDLMRTDMLHEGMILDISTKFEISSASLDKLTKTHVLFPTSTDGMIERVKALQKLVAFFFGEISYAAQGLKSLVNKCLGNKSLLHVKNPWMMDS